MNIVKLYNTVLMANFFKIMTVSMFLTGGLSATAQSDGFKYSDERFADLQMLRRKLDGYGLHDAMVLSEKAVKSK